ncbi:MAG: TonB family protein [Balneolaceae bacterium]|nr:TonB family protein [Balneolaceae bacterium]
MESYIIKIASYTEHVIYFIWLPLLIWTLISIPIWLFLRSAKKVHPQYQYHGRLALIYALPAGIIFLGLLQGVASVLFPESPAETMKIVTFASPVEIGITASEPSSVITNSELAYAGTALLFVSGIIFLMGRFLRQWMQISRLKRTLAFSPIQEAYNLDPVNRKLATAHPRPIRLAFLKEALVPVTFGFRKPVILLPESLREDAEKCNLAIRHELTHIRQKDFITHTAVLMTQMLFWFHPLVHQFKKEMVDYREMRCDSMVLSGRNVSRKKYASLLLELLPMPVVNKELSVNMAQESSNLKKRIQMIAQQNLNKPIPKRSSLAIFGTIILCTVIAMACTDMQTQEVFDNEELNLMTDVDRTGERGYHQILIFMSDEEQAERHQDAITQLMQTQPGQIMSVNVLKGDTAIEKYGERGTDGVIEINTNIDEESYNTVLRTLGMETEDLNLYDPEEAQDFFVVVEEMPELIGGLESIQQEIRYPEMARRAGIEGRVYVQFIINENGDVEYARVIRGIGGGADEEALRVVNMAKFEPGMQRGQPVRVQYALPIFFQLPENESNTEQTNALPEEMDNAINMIGFFPLD